MAGSGNMIDHLAIPLDGERRAILRFEKPQDIASMDVGYVIEQIRFCK